MTDLILQASDVFVRDVAPILMIIGSGLLLGRFFHLDIPTLSRVNIYLLVPALVFSRLVNVRLSGKEALWIIVAVVLNSLLLCGLMGLITSFTKLEDRTRMSVCVASAWGNSGNFGLPVMELMFGSFGAGVQAVVHATTNVLAFSLGFYLLGRSQKPSYEALRMVLQMPSLYAAALALALRSLSVRLPEPLMTSVDRLAAGMIPVALLLLGLQLRETRGLHQIPLLTGAAFTRLILSPLLMLALTLWLPLSPRTAAVLIVGAGVPAAVNAAVLANEAGSDSPFCASLIVITTVFSPITITIIRTLVR